MRGELRGGDCGEGGIGGWGCHFVVILSGLIGLCLLLFFGVLLDERAMWSG